MKSDVTNNIRKEERMSWETGKPSNTSRCANRATDRLKEPTKKKNKKRTGDKTSEREDCAEKTNE